MGVPRTVRRTVAAKPFPPASVDAGDETPVDDVRDPPFESSDRFFGSLTLSNLLLVVVAALAGVSELGDGGDVEDVVEFAGPYRVEPMPGPIARRGFDGGGGVLRRPRDLPSSLSASSERVPDWRVKIRALRCAMLFA
jgi:hypothetical protein